MQRQTPALRHTKQAPDIGDNALDVGKLRQKQNSRLIRAVPRLLMKPNPTVDTEFRSYSLLAKVLMIGIPALMYLAAASQSIAMQESLSPNAAPNLADLSMDGALFLTRIGAILIGVPATIMALFGSPGLSAAAWMVRHPKQPQAIEPLTTPLSTTPTPHGETNER
jgi:hypothetical protein